MQPSLDAAVKTTFTTTPLSCTPHHLNTPNLGIPGEKGSVGPIGWPGAKGECIYASIVVVVEDLCRARSIGDCKTCKFCNRHSGKLLLGSVVDLSARCCYMRVLESANMSL